ncbi:MAG: hypothetical protein GX549_09070 [Clostridiales bacterium]|nr:hypothetical protein [Clostridiales bacterium]
MTLDEGLGGIVRDAVARALERAGAPRGLRTELLRPSDDTLWDTATQAALLWSARSGRDATELAQALCGVLRGEPEIGRCDAVSPGYLNIRIDDRVLMDAALSHWGAQRRDEIPLLPTGHPMGAGPPFTRRLGALLAFGLYPQDTPDAGHPAVRRLLGRLVSVRAALERGKGLPEEMARLTADFEPCHRERVLTEPLVCSVREAARMLIRTYKGG